MKTGATPGERHPYMPTRQHLRLSLSRNVSADMQDRLTAHTCCYPLTALCVQLSFTVANILVCAVFCSASSERVDS